MSDLRWGHSSLDDQCTDRNAANATSSYQYQDSHTDENIIIVDVFYALGVLTISGR